MSSAPHSNARISPNKLNIHEERLKNSKRMFDQLHRTHMHTFVVRKKHLEQQEQNQVAELIKAEGKAVQGNDEAQFNRLGVAKGRKSDNIEIIKKMLEINSLNNAKRNSEMETNRNGIKYRAGKNLQSNTARQRESRIFDDAPQNNQNLYMRRSIKVVRGSHDLDERYHRQVSQLSRQSLADKNKKRIYHNYSEISSKQLDICKMASPMQSRSSSKPVSLPKSIHSRPTNSDNSLSSVETLIPLSLRSYVLFINAPEDIKELNIHFNFSPLRKMSPTEAWKQLDTRNAKVIENLLFGIAQSLQKTKKSHNKDDDENATGVDLKFIKDCCRLYFNNYEKAKLEMILKEHYFKTYAFKLNPLFVYQRIGMYICYLLCCKVSRTSHQTQELIAMILSLKSIYALIIAVITQTELASPTIHSVASAFQGRNQKQMEETFQILRLVGEIQKHVNELEKHISLLVQSVAGGDKTNNDIWEIYRVMKQFLKEESYGVGAKSYENFIKTEMLLSWRYLQVPPTPFLPPIKPNYRYSIVLDLDETLLYFSQESNILKFRPFLQLFLTGLKTLNFEIICFSASSKSYADTLIKQIEHKAKIFEYRLYREHLSLFNGRLVKDIRRLGRDMSKTILVDDLKANFINCAENCIEVSSWQGNKADTQLLTITGLLRKIKKNEESAQNKQKSIDLRVLLKQNGNTLQQMLEVNESIH